MPKGSLYAAHRAAGAASGRYKASLYDIANVGYAMEADVGIEQYKQKRTQETYATIGEALGLAETIRGGFESKKRHEELVDKYDLKDDKSKSSQPGFYGEKAGFDIGDLWGEKSIWKGKPSSVTPKKSTTSKTTKKVQTIGSKTNPFDISDVGDLFRQAKKAGVEEGSKIWGKIGDEVKEWLYEYK